jgi:hypothetical protein
MFVNVILSTSVMIIDDLKNITFKSTK